MQINVIAHPNSRKPRIEKDLLGTMHIFVSEPPLENRANIAVIESLARHFSVKKNRIRFLSGQKSKIKLFEIIKT